jgi:hypothetical protein
MLKKIVVVDIDGTISKVGDRIKHLQQEKHDWDSFYNRCGEDEPITKIIDLVNALSEHYNIMFCSGRRESCRKDTVEWFRKNNVLIDSPYYAILLRADGDIRPDTVVKPELLSNFIISNDEVAFILEDRDSVVKKWRELGFTCLQVAEGDF